MTKFRFVIKQYIKMFVQGVVLPLYYRIYRGRPLDEKLVIFADAHNHTMPYSMELIHKKFVDEGYKVVDIFSDYGNDGFMTTTKNMFRFMKMYAVAKYVIICDYFLPVAACKKREETKVIQLWHACGIFKKFAYEAEDDIPSFYKCKVIKNLNLVTVSSPACEPVYSRAMDLPEEIVRAVGVSRTDRFFDNEYKSACREQLYNKYPEARGKKIALWAPTFRGNAALPYLEGKEDVLALREKLGEEWFVLVRVHPHFHDREINCDISTEELFPVIDLLISDYSTVIFEFSIFNKPLVLFAPDYETYGKHRGFYINYTDLPGRIITDKNSLAQGVIDEYEQFNAEYMLNFNKKYMSACDGKSTERIYDEIIKLG